MTHDIEAGEFHWRDGWRFKRVGCDVRIRTPDGQTVVIPAFEWASIVTHVSAAEPSEHARAYGLILAMQMMAFTSSLAEGRIPTPAAASTPESQEMITCPKCTSDNVKTVGRCQRCSHWWNPHLVDKDNA